MATIKKTVTTVNNKPKRTRKSASELIEQQSEELKVKAENQVDERLLARQQAREKRKLFTDDLEILIFCNAGNTEVIIKTHTNGGENTYNMKFGDTQWMTYKELKELKNTQLFKDYTIKPIDVDSDKLTLEDVIKELGIDDLYENESMLYEDDLNYILNGLDYDKFVLYINTVNKEYLARIIDLAIDQAKKGGFNSANKRMYLEKLINKKGMFEEAINVALG